MRIPVPVAARSPSGASTGRPCLSKVGVVAGERRTVPTREVDTLLSLALSRPHEALERARALIAARPPAAVAAAAHQAAGVVLRDFGDIDQALIEFRAAVRAAHRSGDAVREADVRSSYAVALLMAGRPAAGLAQVRAAESKATGRAAGRIHVRRAYCLWMLGRHAEMLDAAQRAVALLRDADDAWAGRAMAHRAHAHLALGALTRAERDYARAEALFTAAGQQLEYAATMDSRATVAFVRGDLPAALRMLDEADAVVDALGVFEPDLVVTRAQVLLAAGLDREALAVADAGVRRSERLRGSAARRGELLLAAALAARRAGDPATASARGEQALQLFRRQRRPGWAARAELVLLDSRFAAGAPPGSLLRTANRLVGRLEPADAWLLAQAHLLAGRIALSAGRRALGLGHLRAAGGRTRDLRARGTVWLARAELADSEGRPADMLAACARGLDAVETYLRAFGATELRAHATAQGAELATLALRHAARAGDARGLLVWSERWRATALAATPVTQRTDPAMAQDLAALRTLVRRLEPMTGGTRTHVPELEHERRRLEAAVRNHALHTPGTTGTRARPTRLRLGDVRAELADTELVELADVDGQLYGVLVRQGRPARALHVGATAAADRAVAHALFALRRQGPRQARHPLDLAAIGSRLQATLLGPLAEALTAPDVVLVPPGRLNAVPWALLPALRDRSVAVAPSAAAWLRARHARRPAPGRVVIVGGPGLAAAPEEVRRLAEQYAGATVLAGGEATCDRVLRAMDGAWLVHVAAHGVFRSDSPLFSALELDDGPLTVYDLERLHRAPHRVVLSSCDSALGTPSGADEILGVVSALMALGSAGVVASVVPVDDPGTVPFMLELHRRLPGADLGTALAAARRAVETDPVARFPAESFIALGA